MLLSFVWRDAYVAPRVGAWIETLITAIIFAEESMSLPAWGAWIEALSAFVVQGHHRSLCALFNQDIMTV